MAKFEKDAEAMVSLHMKSVIRGPRTSDFSHVATLVSAIGSFVQPFSQNSTVERVNDKELSELKLIGPEAPCIGLLQVRYRGRWGSVCSSPWDSSTGEVVCRQIGCNAYHTTLAIPISQETGPILLDKVHCNGTESSLWECPLSASDQQGCETGTTVGYFCKVKQNAMLKDGGSPCAGRVEASSFTLFRVLCGRMWDMNEARAFCKFLNCGDAVSASGNSQFGAGVVPILNTELHCKGTEDDPWKCEMKPLAHRNCSAETEAAGVVCSEHREPRLVGGTDGCSGRLEVQKGNTWGTVCDSHWDSQDARVVCASLKCGGVIAVLGEAQFGEGSGPVWQDIYECQGQRGPRLVGGNDTCSGRLEILQGDTWGTVCDTYWDLQDAAAVCNQLGCGVATATPGGAFFGEGNGTIWNDVNECIGNEMHLRDCPVSSWGHREDWQMRLGNGETMCDGRVEVYYGGIWGRVTDTQWNYNDADVVCRQLNCGSAIRVYNHSKFGKGTGPSWINNVRCNGSESFLWNCSFTQMKESSIADDVGVICSDHIQIRLVDSGSHCAGRVELYYNGSWGTVCDDSWDLADAQVVCNQLRCGQALNTTISEHRAVRLQDGANLCQGRVEVFYNGTWGTVCADSFGIKEAQVVCRQLLCGSAQSVERAITFGRGSGQIWLDDVNCRLHDTLLWHCPSSPWGQHDCDHKEDVGIICSELRLAAGLNNCSGRVEIFFRGMWGTVCDDSWDRHDAAVVCRQLNCGEPVWTVEETLFGQANGTIWMNKVQCKGSELFLSDCLLSAMGDHVCEHEEDVNVICSGHQKHTAPFNQQRPSIFIIPCVFVVLLIAVSLALAAELQRSFQKANRNIQHCTTGFPDPVYEEIEVQELGTGADLHSTSSLNKLEYYTESELHEYENTNMEDSLTFFDTEFGRQHDDI
ncbi:scavenger receptor cysteine-rich type 1 protein M130-like [Rhincodon typus]|uniref:scavenger receptor cysteine-rich type 1 protein M130-like n=1 Tax=Rhincodon typus TaxID=259920 RepID=UPI00202FCCA1|nr:scavenger receptor cysteine-rich type 1 protein M130-like [Rhincodon typus]